MPDITKDLLEEERAALAQQHEQLLAQLNLNRGKRAVIDRLLAYLAQPEEAPPPATGDTTDQAE